MTIDQESCSEVIDFAAQLLAIVDVISMDTGIPTDSVLSQIIDAARIRHGKGIAAFCEEYEQAVFPARLY